MRAFLGTLELEARTLGRLRAPDVLREVVCTKQGQAALLAALARERADLVLAHGSSASNGRLDELTDEYPEFLASWGTLCELTRVARERNTENGRRIDECRHANVIAMNVLREAVVKQGAVALYTARGASQLARDGGDLAIG